jgi:tRNA threonylcarbamoyladenosine biosynthesis protein TsaE
MIIYESYKEEDTFNIGKYIASKIKPGDIVCLDGDLGVGKTVFTKGFAIGLEIEDCITSPTFTIVQEYEEGRIPLYHFDVYRIADPEEMFEIGFEEYINGNGVCLIEWATMIEDILQGDLIKVNIRKDLDKGVDYREIAVEGIEN